MNLVNGQKVVLNEFKLRLQQLESLVNPSSSSIKMKMADYLKTMKEPTRKKIDLKALLKLRRDKEEKESQEQTTFVQNAISSDWSDVYEYYRDLVCFNYELSEHETFNHPVARKHTLFHS